MNKNMLDEANTLWEYLLTTYGYCPGPANLRNERFYHAIFQPAFHEACFLSLYITVPKTDAILTFGYLNKSWDLKKQRELTLAISQMPQFPLHQADEPASSKRLHMESFREHYHFPSVSDNESTYIKNVQMGTVPIEALQHFEQQMLPIQPLKLNTLMLSPEQARDGIAARGIITNQYGAHRFDIWPEPLTNNHKSFFLEFIRLASVCLAEAEQKHLQTILRYF